MIASRARLEAKIANQRKTIKALYKKLKSTEATSQQKRANSLEKKMWDARTQVKMLQATLFQIATLSPGCTVSADMAIRIAKEAIK